MDAHLIADLVTADVPLTPENVRPGWLALVVVLVLIAAVVLLARSFMKHAKRAAEPWEGDDRDERPGRDHSA